VAVGAESIDESKIPLSHYRANFGDKK